MGGGIKDHVKQIFNEDNIVKVLKEAKLIDENHIKEDDVRKLVNNCDQKYESMKIKVVNAFGAASDATRTFISVVRSPDEEEIPPIPMLTRKETAEDLGPHLSKEARSFIKKIDTGNKIDIEDLDHKVGAVKHKSKEILEEADKRYKKVKNAAEEAVVVFRASYLERMKKSQRDDDDD